MLNIETIESKIIIKMTIIFLKYCCNSLQSEFPRKTQNQLLDRVIS